LRPLIFFDDSIKNCDDACATTSTARVPVEGKTKFVIALSSGAPARSPERFFKVCKLYLKKNFENHEPELRVWQEENLSGLSDEAFENFTLELERSAQKTPAGKQRRAAGAYNDDYVKLLQFLDNLRSKHSS
jgi:hypothetical protein